MSKDKGSKNNKKAPADKSKGKIKSSSSYKEEGKVGKEKPTIDVFSKKSDGKKDKPEKS